MKINGDNSLFDEGLEILMDEFRSFVYPLIIPDPDSVFSYLCSILKHFNDTDSQKSFFKIKNIKIPPTPSFKKRRNLCFDFGYIEDFLKTLQLPDIMRQNVRTGFYSDDLSFQDFLNKNPRYQKFIHNLCLYNIEHDYTKLQKIKITKCKKTNDFKKIKNIKKMGLKKRKILPPL